MIQRFTLAVSLFLNLVLAATIALREKPDTDAPSLSVPATNFRNIVRASIKAWDNETPADPTRRRAPAASGSLEAEDYPTFVKRLREAGLSDDTIALLVVNELGREQARTTREWSRLISTGELSHEEYQKRRFQLQWDTKRLVEELLGADVYRRQQLRHDMWIQMLRHSGDFSEEVLGKYLDERTRQQERLFQLFLKEGAKAENPYEYMVLYGYGLNDWSELEKELGPETARKIRLTTDYRSMHLTGQFQSLKLTDEELDKVGQTAMDTEKRKYQLHIARSKSGGEDQQQLYAEIQSLEVEKKTQLIAILGPDRYAEYEKQTDYRYTQLKGFAQYNRLTDEQVNHVYRVWKSCMDRHNELNRYIQARPSR